MRQIKLGVKERISALHCSLIPKLLVCGKVWLAGGAARSIFTKEPINDYDIFFKDYLALLETKQSLEKIKECKLVFACKSNKLFTYKLHGIKIQLITHKFFKNEDELIDSFDFECTRFLTDGITLFTTDIALSDAKRKKLRMHKLSYPAATIKRINKYISRGYTPVQGFYESIVDKIQENKEIIDSDLVYID